MKFRPDIESDFCAPLDSSESPGEGVDPPAGGQLNLKLKEKRRAMTEETIGPKPADDELGVVGKDAPSEEPNPNQRRYNMYPQKSFGGHVETKVLPDGRIKYTLFPFPFDGSDKRVIIVDPANPEEMRAVKQLHLIPDIKNDPGVGVYVFDADLLDGRKRSS
ncbi:MAG: hypothetical protein IPK78_07740 [Rhodospirillales bacterium]|nr:hypothetical protein [Rhodospirillales bacterium]